MNFKYLEKHVGIKKYDPSTDPFLWNDPVIDLPHTTNIKDKIPMLFKGVSAYVVDNGRLYYLTEDDGYFRTYVEIHALNQLSELKNTFMLFLNMVNNKTDPGIYITENKHELSRKLGSRLRIITYEEDIENPTIIFPIGYKLRELHWSWLEDELWLINKIFSIKE